jgi:hypothetical protein
MNDVFKQLLIDRKRINEQQRKLNEKVRQASEGRAHHQGCPLGGLFTGMAANVSGSPCWCGCSESSDGRSAEHNNGD